MTIAMSPEEAREIVQCAEDAMQPLPVYLRNLLRMSRVPLPELIELHKQRGSYPSFLDLFAERGFRSVVLTFSKYPSDVPTPDKLVLAATIDEVKGITATIAVKDMHLWEKMIGGYGDSGGQTLSTQNARKKKKPPVYRFPDSEAGNA